jgi:transglutaminase-like putative cysteine protease
MTAPGTRSAVTTAVPDLGGLGAGRRYGALPVTAGLAAVAGLAFHRVFGWGPVIPVTAVAVAGPTVLSGLLSGPRKGKRPWPLWISLLLTVAGWPAVCTLTLFRDRLGDGSALRAMGTGLRNAWQSILTTLLPAPDRPELLVLVSAVVWLVAFAGAETALRTELRGAPALPALGGVAIALLLGVDGPGSNLPIVVAFVLLLGALVLIRTPGTGVRRLLIGVPIALVLGLLALAIGPYVPVRGQAYNPRKQVQAPPPQTRDSVSPLDRISAWLYRPDEPMFTVRATSPENWRLAVLDKFDGLDWTTSAHFVPTGSQVPPAPYTGKTSTVRQRVTVQDLPGVWVPAADRARSITGLQVTVDETSGVVAAGQELRSGQTYQVTSAVPAWSTGELASAVPAQDAEAKAALALPWGPGATKEPAELAEFRQMAQQAVQGALSPIQQAAALASWFSGQGRYDVTARPGHTYSQLAWFLCQAPVKGKCTSQMRGTPEQFATAYAIMARSLGLPTRVAVGFRPGTDMGNGVREVKAGDVLAWPEVKFAGLGWVPFNPTPAQAGTNKSDAIAAGDTQQKVEALQKNAATNAGGSVGGGAKTPPSRKPAAQKPAKSGTPVWLYATAALGAAAICYLIAVFAVPALRRRRRRTGPTPAHRIAGAWHQVVERLGEVGLSGVRTRTAHEVVDFGTRAVGEPAAGPLGRLADLVNHSRYADTPADPRAAEEAWQHSDQIGRLVTRRTGRLRRLRNRLHPRSLTRR